MNSSGLGNKSLTNGVRAVFANIVTVDEESLRKDITNLVRKTFDETFRVLIDEEASELVEAEYYERMACGGLAAAATTRESSSAVSESRVQRAETTRRLPDGHHRALPQAQDLGLGGRRRDAPRGCLEQQD